jgi:amidase
MARLTRYHGPVHAFAHTWTNQGYARSQARLQRRLGRHEPLRRPDFTLFEGVLEPIDDERLAELDRLLRDASIAAMQRLMETGTLTAEALTAYYLARIRRYDDRLRSVVELNPEALAIAGALDDERRAGRVRGPLHGIPLLLKDNIGTGDHMHTTAGAAALLDARADRDAFLVTRLRAAGAVILGKTNLSEWANYMTSHSANGFSAVGGQTVNPGWRCDVGGSSSGSAAAVAAGFAAAAIGTETYGSIVNPATQNGVVGHKPTHGLVSRDRIIPITDATDTAGPLARSAADARLVLEAIGGHDERDAASLGVTSDLARGKARFGGGLAGVRIGLLASPVWRLGERAARRRAIKALQAAGATIVETPLSPPRTEFHAIFDFGLREGVDAYLAATGAPARSLADVIAFNRRDLARYAPRGQDRLERALDTGLTRSGYDTMVRASREAALGVVRGALQSNRLDLLITFDTLDMHHGIFNMAGAPMLCLPLGGPADGPPISIVLAADLGRDGALLEAGAIFEQSHATVG